MIANPDMEEKIIEKHAEVSFPFYFFPTNIFEFWNFSWNQNVIKKFREIKILLKNFVKLIGFFKLFQKLYD